MKKIILTSLVGALCCNAFATGNITVKIDDAVYGLTNTFMSDDGQGTSTKGSFAYSKEYLPNQKWDIIEDHLAYELGRTWNIFTLSAIKKDKDDAGMNPESCVNINKKLEDNLDHPVTISLNGCSVS